MSALSRTLLLALIGVAALPAGAQQQQDNLTKAQVAEKIGAKPEELRQSPIPGMYEYARGAEIAYVSTDGKYAIDGDLYEMGTNRNLSEATRRVERAKLIADVPESQMLVFAPKDPKYTVSVFTDVDCAYCQQLHSQMAEYNRLGIKVRYLFYPRSGPHTESWAKAEEVWCSADRGKALTRANRGESLPTPKQCATPIARQYALGKDLGVRGTPAIVLPNGEMLPGYLPPQALAMRLRTATAAR